MTPSLRKRHRFIWIILAIVLPILFGLAIRGIPQPVHQKVLFQQSQIETTE